MVFPALRQSLRAVASLGKHTRSLSQISSSSSFKQWRASTSLTANMATPNTIRLTVDDIGVVNFKPQNQETATKISELLQENHEVRNSDRHPSA